MNDSYPMSTTADGMVGSRYRLFSVRVTTFVTDGISKENQA